MLLNPFNLHKPETLDEAVKLYADIKDAKILAGGTILIKNLKVLKKKDAKTPENIISLRRLKELHGLSLEKDQLTIGSMATISKIFDSTLLTDNLSVLKTVCRNLGTTTIRNMATLGGNLISRFTWAEMGTAMVALDATMHFINKDGKNEAVCAEDFYMNGAKTDKILTHVSIKKVPDDVSTYSRISKRSPVDIPLLSICLKSNIQKNKFANTRVAVNNSIDFTQRDQVLEDFLNNSRIEKGTELKALDHLNTSIYDKGDNDYKKHIFRVVIKNAIQKLIDQSGKQ